MYINMKLVINKFNSGGLHEKHAVATCSLGNHQHSLFRHRDTKKNQTQGNQEKPNLSSTVLLRSFLALALDGGEALTSRSGRLHPVKNHSTH